jgi:hypothetical protein
MADNNNKVTMPGKTVYLKEGESFDNVRNSSGSLGQEQPAQSSNSAVRASSQNPPRPIRSMQQGQSSVVRATAQPPVQPQRPAQAQQTQQPTEQKTQFLRASKAPVTVVQDLPPEPENKEEAKSQFLRASSMKIEPGPQVDPNFKPEQPAVQVQEPEVQTEVEPEAEEPANDIQQVEEVELSAEEGVEEPETAEEGQEMVDNNKIIPEAVNSVTNQQKQPEQKSRPKPVDLSKLTILSKTEMDKEKDLRQALYNNKSAFQIVAAQSGYVAKVTPLVHRDTVNLLDSSLSRYEYKKAVYKTVHDKVLDTSVGKMDFEPWLKNTTVEDMETFYYGVYSATFPNEGTFRYTCSKCGKEHDYKVNHANLIKTTDRESMKKLIDDVSRNSTSPEKMKEFSLINKNQAIELGQSRLVVDLRTPSLQDSLEILRTVPEKTIDKDAITITNILYINRVLIPAKESSGYTEESNKTSILRIIDNLSIEDANDLQKAVYDRVDENRITYSIKNIKCSDCAHEEREIPISIEDILFTLIFEKAQ